MIKGLIKNLDKSIVDMGLILAIKKFLKKCNTEVIVKSNNEINRLLKKSSGIIVANHPSESDILVILSAVKNRKDVFLIVSSQFKGMIPEMDNHLIPIYIYNRIIENFNGRFKLTLLNLFNKVPVYSKEEEHQKNIESIKMATEKINEGGLVIIFPNGGNRKNDWFYGIGHLIHGVETSKKSFVIRAYIEGTSNFDYLRLLPLFGKILPKLKVSFSKPLLINQIKKDDPKQTTKYLESRYGDWLNSFNLWTNLSKNHLWLRTLFLFLVTKH